MGKRAPADSWPVQLRRDHLWEKEAQVRMWNMTEVLWGEIWVERCKAILIQHLGK